MELEPLHFGAQGNHHKYEGASNGVGSKGDLKPKNGFGGFGDLANKMMRRIKQKSQAHNLDICCPNSP